MDSSEEESASHNFKMAVERDSMVLVGESFVKDKKKPKMPKLKVENNEDERRQRVISELESNIEMEEDLNDADRDSIFRSR